MGRQVFDWLIVPAGILFLAFDPNYRHGFVDYLEAGLHLGPINGIFHGEVPYRDSYTLFGPLFLYTPALIMAVFGKTLAVLRAYFHAAALLNLLIAYGVGRLVCRTRLMRYAIPLILLVEFHHPFWSTRWGGLRVGLELLVLAGLLRYMQSQARRPLLLAGVLSGLGLLYSTDVGIVSIATAGLLAVWLAWQGTDLRRLARDGFVYLGGFACGVLPLLICFAMTGALWPYLRTAFLEMPLNHMAVWGGHHGLPAIAEAYQAAGGPWSFLMSGTVKVYLLSLVSAGAALYVLRARRRAPDIAAVVFLLTVHGFLLYLMAFRAIEGPQFQMALPAYVLLCALGVERGMAWLRAELDTWRISGRRIHGAALLSGVLIAAGLVYFLGSEKRYYGSLMDWAKYQRHKRELTTNYTQPMWASQIQWARLQCARCGGVKVPQAQQQEIDGVTQFLLEQTAPDEAVFAFPEHGIFNFFADRPGVSRFDIAGMAWTTPAWQAELRQALTTHPPRFAVVGKKLSKLALLIERSEELFPDIRTWLAERYHPIRDFPTVAILESGGR
jgi:hypothetical protein